MGKAVLPNEVLSHPEINSSWVEIHWWSSGHFLGLISAYSDFLTLCWNHDELCSSWRWLLSQANVFASSTPSPSSTYQLLNLPTLSFLLILQEVLSDVRGLGFAPCPSLPSLGPEPGFQSTLHFPFCYWVSRCLPFHSEAWRGRQAGLFLAQN